MNKYRAEQIVQKLRQAAVELGKGLRVKEVCRKIEISQQTYYRWQHKYGGEVCWDYLSGALWIGYAHA